MDKNKTSKTKVARILVVEDHGVVREGFVALINRESDLEVCAEADTPSAAQKALAKEMPDLAIIDLLLHGGDGINLIKDLIALHPNLPILVVSMQDEEIFAERALRAGAKGYIMKEQATEVFLDAIRMVLEGNIYLSNKMHVRLLNKFIDGKTRVEGSPIESLTDRQLHVFQLIGAGLPTREIAQKLGISTKTVESYRENIKHKLDLKDGAALVQEAITWMQNQNS